MENKKASLNEEKKRFELKIEDQMATVYYNINEPSVWTLTHTLVPESLKGRGIGSDLIKQVLHYCRENNIRIIPQCPFIAAYIKKHPEWKDLLAEQTP